jgi:hypothetical protein
MEDMSVRHMNGTRMLDVGFAIQAASRSPFYPRDVGN